MIFPLLLFLAVLAVDPPSAEARCASPTTTVQLELEELTLDGAVQSLALGEDVRLTFVGGGRAELGVDGSTVLLDRSGGVDGGAGE